MTQTNTEYVFQLTGPVADRNFSAASANDSTDKFGDHLSQASANARDESYQPSNNSRGTEPPAYNDRQPDKNSCRDDDTQSAGPARPTANEKDTSSPAKASSPEQNDSAPAVNDKKESTDEVDANEHDHDKSDTKVINEQAAGMQAASVTTPQARKTPIVSATLIADTGSNSATDNPSSNSAENDASTSLNIQAIGGDDSSFQSVVHVAERTIALVAAADEATETPKGPAAAINEAKQSQAPVAAVQQSKNEKAAAPLPNSKSDGDPKHEGASQNEPAAEPAGNANVAANAAQNMAGQSQVNPTLPVSTASNGVSKCDEASQDDPHDGSRTGARAGVSTDTIAQSNKAAIVPVANGAAANSGDAPTNVQPKGEKNVQVAKPITAQGELADASFASLSRANSGVGRNGQPASSNEAPLVDPTRFVGRVAKAFQTAHDRGGTLQLRLSPPELGSLRLELTVKDGVMSASLQTDNANARRLLLDHLPALRDRLAEQNIRVDRFDVDVRREGTGSQADTRGSQQQAFQHQPEHPAPRRQPAPQPQPRDSVRQETLAVAPSVSDAGLNLIV